MNAKLKVELSPPSAGWMQLALGSGEQELTVVVSYTPFSLLDELASALAGFIESRRDGVVRINCEPEEYDLLFESASESSDLRVTAVFYPKGRSYKSLSEIAFVYEGETIQTARTFWRALRKLESHFDSNEWAHGFPTKLVEYLGTLTAVARVQPR